jgi:quaternary ammonium compound-resistance protein SugE
MTPTLAWIALILAGIFEVVWAYFLKQSDGFAKALPSILFVATLAISMILLALSVKTIPISIAYPIWTGIGAVGSIIVGVMFFGEAFSLLTSLFLIMIISGIIGLKFFS